MNWTDCLNYLKDEISQQEFQTWISPLQFAEENESIILLAPNLWVANYVENNYSQYFVDFFNKTISIKVGSYNDNLKNSVTYNKERSSGKSQNITALIDRFNPSENKSSNNYSSTINKDLTFDNYIEGQCNMLARAAAIQIVQHNDNEFDRSAYNPFLIYGGTGLGKTHLLHAIGNKILERDSSAVVYYTNATKFVNDMVSAFKNKTIDQFKNTYRSVDALLVDDIHLFADKDRTQEEFFHTFNILLEGQKQIIMTCDKYPKEMTGIENRLKSRFSWGLTVGIEMPDVETRVAILISKAEILNIELPQNVAFFIAQNIHSNIRELEGALKRVIATARFFRKPITISFAQEALKDLLSAQQKLTSIDNIQKVICDYYHIRLKDILSKSRSRFITRPRQMSMYICKQLTNFSVKEIGENHGGRDHTTVLHACKKIEELMKNDSKLIEDSNNIKKLLIGG